MPPTLYLRPVRVGRTDRVENNIGIDFVGPRLTARNARYYDVRCGRGRNFRPSAADRRNKRNLRVTD